jgi:hypothetical protein
MPSRFKYNLAPIWQFLVGGYLTFGRSFAYLGVPPLFIGEAFIGYSIIANRNRWLQRFIDDLFHLRFVAAGVGLTILWGLFEVFRAYFVGKIPILDVAKTFAFNYYTICLPIGIACGAGVTIASFIRFWKVFSLFYCGYAVAYLVVASAQLDLALPWADVAIFNDPTIPAVVPIGILALWPYLRDWKLKYPVLLVSVLPMLYNPGRGAVLGMAVGLVCVALVSVQRVFTVMFLTVGGFVLLSIIGPMIPGGRAEALDPIFGIARVVSTFDEDAAARMLRDAGYPHAAEEMTIAAGTAEWRKQIWLGVLKSLNTTELQLIGHGHGADLTQFTPGGEEIRTPHNFIIYAIFYTGAVGLAFYALLIAAILLRIYGIPDRNVRALAFAVVLMTCLLAAVGNVFETPMGAIPFYLLVGVMIGADYRAARPGPVVLVQSEPAVLSGPAAAGARRPEVARA